MNVLILSVCMFNLKYYGHVRAKNGLLCRSILNFLKNPQFHNVSCKAGFHEKDLERKVFRKEEEENS